MKAKGFQSILVLEYDLYKLVTKLMLARARNTSNPSTALYVCVCVCLCVCVCIGTIQIKITRYYKEARPYE